MLLLAVFHYSALVVNGPSVASISSFSVLSLCAILVDRFASYGMKVQDVDTEYLLDNFRPFVATACTPMSIKLVRS